MTMPNRGQQVSRARSDVADLIHKLIHRLEDLEWGLRASLINPLQLVANHGVREDGALRGLQGRPHPIDPQFKDRPAIRRGDQPVGLGFNGKPENVNEAGKKAASPTVS